jgi:hypothetical protein
VEGVPGVADPGAPAHHGGEPAYQPARMP